MQRCSYYLILTLCLVGISISQPKNNKKNLQSTSVDFASRALQGFGMKVWLSNQMNMGLQAWDCTSQDCIPVDPKFGMQYPEGSNIEHIYVVAPLIGGKIDGVIKVTEGFNSYSSRKEFIPEYRHLLREHFWRTARRDSIGVPNRRYCDDDGDGLTDEDDLDGTDNDGDWNPVFDDVGGDGLADLYEISCDGIPYDSMNNPDPADDNYEPDIRDSCHANPDGSFPFKNNRDRWTEKNGLPDHGEPHVDEDYAAISDNDLYCSAIDTFTRPVFIGRVPMGIKCIQKSYAWDSELYEAVIPFDYYFINLGRKTITDVYVGFYADMDVGPVDCPDYQQLNYSAYMESVRTAYSHNAICRGSTPAGITLLGASVPMDSLRLIWTWCDFRWRPCYGDDDSSLYTWMNGDAFPGLPIFPNQVPTMPLDTRFLLSVGPFRVMKPGDTIKVSIALISGDNVVEGSNSLKENAIKAHNLYKRSYNLPIKPVSPKLDIITGYQKVELKWYPHTSASAGSNISPIDVWDDSNKLADSYPIDHWRRINPPCGDVNGECVYHMCDENGRLPGGRNFAGFRLYRSEDPNCDRNSFVLMREYLLPDTATEWSLVNIDSVFIDSNLSREKSFWYAVTTIGLPDITILPIPQPDGSTRYDTLYYDYNESNLSENWVKADVPLCLPSEEAGKVLVVPNPYRVNEYYSTEYGGWEGPERSWNENKRLIKFIRLPKGEWTLRIFTLVGEKVTVIKNTQTSGYEQGGRWIGEYREDRAEISFELLSESGRALASGVYIFLVDSDYGQQTGKFVVIR